MSVVISPTLQITCEIYPVCTTDTAKPLIIRKQRIMIQRIPRAPDLLNQNPVIIEEFWV